MFFGHPGFHSGAGPLLRWTAFKSPAQPGDPASSFGHSVQAVDLDADGHAEIVVGAPERSAGDGKVHIYDGDRVAALSPFSVHDGASFPADQTLLPPAALIEDDPNLHLAFGWIVFSIGDMAGTDYGTANGRPDIAVHTEAGKWVAPTGPYVDIPDAGALVVYAAWDPADGTPPPGVFVKSPGITIQTPLVWEPFVVGPGQIEPRLMHMPQRGARFGRAAAPVEWRDAAGSVVRGLLVGEPNANVHNPSDAAYPDDTPVPDAGRVVFLPAPLDVGQNAATNAWGAIVLLEPRDTLAEWHPTDPRIPLIQTDFDPQPGALFGAWMDRGRYNAAFIADQVFIAARARTLIESGGGPASEAGQVYTFFVPQ